MIAGYYRDVLLDPGGGVAWDGGVRRNVIVADCRRLLTGFLHGAGTTAGGITGLQVGKGDPAWDRPPGPPPATAGQAALVDRHPFTVPRASLRVDYLTGSTVTSAPTNRLQIVATLGPGVPAWPDADHTDATLREFGLVGVLDGATVLIDYVIHPAIPRDPASTLQRTVWLVL
ncbi:hypothetical protein AGRA3207_002099 [Actinomadura graeca]|uniref:Uncharacterized protein n=1 Tax=Actinomadura graeca TaxID=2750812 RepID=A0ABX8QU52_9ACTN|nr:hypothetical protein [Actinomadura graeca]QXJ21262.1 hypothetical protein AGRA3207_002099 [Actinomadura graeca]